MKTLLIDNYDSYTYNLFQLIAEVNGEEPVVVRNDAPVDGLLDLRAFDNLVVSPGPGHPGVARDLGIGSRLLATSPVPVLGVCLGHQGIALAEAGLVGPAPEPRHGHLSTIRHDGRGLFHGLPQHFTAVRYHSLAVREPLPETLQATAWAEDGVLMGLRHRSRPLWGVQFHPESVLTEYGHRMLVNFRNLTAERAGKPRTKNTAVPMPPAVRRRAVVPECETGIRRATGGAFDAGGARRPVVAAVFQVAAVSRGTAAAQGDAVGRGAVTLPGGAGALAFVGAAASPATPTPGRAGGVASPPRGVPAVRQGAAAEGGPSAPEPSATAPVAGRGTQAEGGLSAPTPGATGPTREATAPTRDTPDTRQAASTEGGPTAPAPCAATPTAGREPAAEGSPCTRIPGATGPGDADAPATEPGPPEEQDAGAEEAVSAPASGSAGVSSGRGVPVGGRVSAGEGESAGDAVGGDVSMPRATAGVGTPAPVVPRPRRPERVGYRLHTRRVTGAVDAEAVFGRMFAGSARAFWLDSSLVEPGRSRFSFLGDDQGPLAEFVRYDVDAGRCEIERAGRPVRRVRASVFDYLKRQLGNRRVDATGLPFDFTGGYVGYFGYEMKADCGSPNRHRSPAPDAAWLFADRVIAVDHEEGFTYAVCLAEDTPHAAREATDWLEGALAEISCVATEQQPPVPGPPPPADPGAAEPWLVRDRATYLADIEACREALRSGTSYEVCLTNAARLPAPADALEFYRTLRRDNPAPYAAFLRFGELEVAGSSPERFLRIGRDGTAEARPIKGTAPRGDGPEEDARLRDALASDAKTRAENLMIVDLLRNDLGQVCRTGTVRVSQLMATETYATVHQLVSTVEGRLRPGTDAVDCVRACFPGGSMTGAPKLRTLEIIDSLETEARGVYSGALGYFGCGGGADLSIVIRTAVLADGVMHLGAGGAIVLGSDPEAEYDEMLLKTAAPMRALHQHTADRMGRQGPPGRTARAAGEARR
ncbi:aminodeoxychorismate synthase component I [Streptomyces sp. NEAU-H22]|uniref:aminodeoxychorismate synthase component I n=1 Tax=Streptomyces sp. NEAU-H22 TaxID=2994655 RepID=UPI0022510C56|nr:aminodeoxychorismate synthase component I [Streptomyces sp. NEAU-H22]MCX3285464.1 aminodeoxychorismate synthase component I [Streptomyces sp. NEAU-H22]